MSRGLQAIESHLYVVLFTSMTGIFCMLGNHNGIFRQFIYSHNFRNMNADTILFILIKMSY